MSLEVKIPPVGESISSGVIAAWHKKNGDAVQANELLLTLETDKVSSEIVAAGSGRLTIQAQEGDEVKIGQVVALIEEGAAAPVPAPATTGPAPNKPAPAPEPDPQPTVQAKAQNLAPESGKGNGSDQPLSPAVRRLVEEDKVSPADLVGTGKGGRLTKGDVLGFVENRLVTPAAAPAPPVAAARVACLAASASVRVEVRCFSRSAI